MSSSSSSSSSSSREAGRNKDDASSCSSASRDLIPPASLLCEPPPISLLSRGLQQEAASRNQSQASSYSSVAANPVVVNRPVFAMSPQRPPRQTRSQLQTNDIARSQPIPIAAPTARSVRHTDEVAVFSASNFTTPDLVQPRTLLPVAEYQPWYAPLYAPDFQWAGYPDPAQNVQRSDFKVKSRPPPPRRPKDMTCYPPPSLANFPENTAKQAPPKEQSPRSFDLDQIMDQSSRDTAAFIEAIETQAKVRRESYRKSVEMNEDILAKQRGLAIYKGMDMRTLTREAHWLIRGLSSEILALKEAAEQQAEQARIDEDILQDLITKGMASCSDAIQSSEPLTSEQLQILRDAGFPEAEPFHPAVASTVSDNDGKKNTDNKGKSKAEAEAEGEMAPTDELWKQWERAAGLRPKRD